VRVRLSKAAAQAEATRRAAAFVAGRDDPDHWRHVSTTPAAKSSQRAAKVPAVWVAVYAPIATGGGVIDGGELFVVVDLESNVINVREY
jgi:hypothetical protein